MFLGVLSNHVVTDTREIAESGFSRGDLETYDLCAKFMNTYLRQAINCKDVSVICGLLHQVNTIIISEWVTFAESIYYYVLMQF